MEAQYRSSIDGCCELCGSKQVTLVSTLHYAALLKLPLFPKSREHQIRCGDCKSYQPTDEPVNNPISRFDYWSKFSGTLLLIALLLYWAVSVKLEQQREIDILQKPQLFDFYMIDRKLMEPSADHLYPFTLSRVVGVTDTSVYLQLGSFGYEQQRNAIRDIRSDKLLTQSYFSQKVLEIPAQTLLEKKQQGLIVKALRPENLSLYGGMVMTPRQVLQAKHKPVSAPITL